MRGLLDDRSGSAAYKRSALGIACYRLLLIAGLGLFPVAGMAQTLVLVHGFQEQGVVWRSSQVAGTLMARGWTDAGNLSLTQNKVLTDEQPPARSGNVFYTLDLPSAAAVSVQGRVLNQYLQAIYAQREEPLILVGHSAGGVVARYWLVAFNTLPVTTLITIATPHLGTPLAGLSDLLVDTPLAEMASRLGMKPLLDSKALYTDLREEKPGNFLYWLNHQSHPVLRYVSVVRSSERPEAFDFVVPASSQDMNNVFTLHQHSEVWRSDDPHFLGVKDGYLLSRIMASQALTRR